MEIEHQYLQDNQKYSRNIEVIKNFNNFPKTRHFFLLLSDLHSLVNIIEHVCFYKDD